MKAVISDKFGGLKVHKTPNGKVERELRPGYQVVVLDNPPRKTATVTWVKIAYVFGGETKEGWVAKEAPLFSGGPRYSTLILVSPPPPMVKVEPPVTLGVTVPPPPDIEPTQEPLKAPKDEIPVILEPAWWSTIRYAGSFIALVGVIYMILASIFYWPPFD